MTTNPQNDSLVKLLVRLTLNRGEREKLQAIVDDLKDKGNSDEAKKELARSGIDPDGVLSIARRLARALDASVLFGEGPIEPYESVRVQPTGELDVVTLDADESTNVDSYFIVASRPFRNARHPGTKGKRRVG